MKKSNVAAVVVTHNRLDMLKDAIEALKAQTYNTDIVIINNGSTDGTFEYLNAVEDIMVIHQDNVGATGGFFSGIKYAAEQGYEYSWVMDDDVIPDKEALHYLLQDYDFLSTLEDVGFVCGRVFSTEHEFANVPSIDYSPNGTGYADWGKYLERGIIPVQSATFVSVLIPTKIVKEVGLPLREYFIWGDDTEYTLRISSKYKCFLSANSNIIHRRVGGILDITSINDKNRVRMYRYFVRNNTWNQHIYRKSLKSLMMWYIRWIWLSIRLFVKGQLLKSRVILSGLWQSFFFRPTIEYPSVK